MAESTLVGHSPALTSFHDSNGLNQRNAYAAARIYSPLKPGEMRLLKLHQGVGRLRCSLLTTSDDPPPEYEALSYVWGSQADLKSIHLNDRPYFITLNLFHALLKLRLRRKDRILWIDALVINQSDLAERAAEVAKMSVIFSRAVKTLVWLGQGNPRIEADMLALANCNVEKANLTSSPGGIGPAIRRAVDSILAVTYWKRAWVVQELMYSDEVLLIYGSSSVLFDHFVEIVDSGMQRLSLAWSDIKFGEARLAIRPGSGRRKEYLRLRTWLEDYCCQRDCTESRDRVFAYHGCFPPAVRNYVKLDYTRSMEDLAMDITIAWIDSERDLEFLSEIGRRGEWRSGQKVSTWVPNYFASPVNVSRLTGYDESSSKTAVRPYFRVFNNRSVFEVKGVWLGTIETVGKQSTNTKRSQVEGLDTYLLDQVYRCQGMIKDLEPELKHLVEMTFDQEDLKSKFTEDHQVSQNISASYDLSKEEIREYSLRKLLYITSSRNRISFRFTPVETSRLVQQGSITIPFGLGTPELQLGDRLCLVVGCKLALILRRVDKQYMVIGNAFVFDFHSGLNLQNNLSEYPSSVIDNISLC